MNDNIHDLMIKMCKGNPGAAHVLGRLFQENINDILILDDMGIHGSAIWIIYKYYCKCNMDKFRDAIKNRDPDMVKYILSKGYHAQTHGASEY